MKNAQIEVARLTATTFSPRLRIPATITGDPRKIAQVGARLQGRVSAIRVKLCDSVRRGQPLVDVDGVEVHQVSLDYLSATAREESRKASNAILPLVPIMLALTLLIIILQVRSMSAMAMVFATAPLGLIGVVPTLLMFQQPFGINALVGLIALSGILMRNTLILLGQVDHNLKEGIAPFDAVVEATVQRARPVILTALAAILAFIPLTHSVFWGTLAYTLIGGTFAGTVLTLVFLPAMYAIWFRIVPRSKHEEEAGRGPSEQTRVRDRTDVRLVALKLAPTDGTSGHESVRTK